MFKKASALITILTLSICFSVSVFAASDAESYISLDSGYAEINGSETYFGSALYTENGITMIPIRLAAEICGANISWDDAAKSAAMQKGDISLVIKPNSDTAQLNGKAVSLGTKAAIENDSLTVPLRSVANIFSCEVYWSEYTNDIIIREEHQLDTEDDEVKEIYSGILSGEKFAMYNLGYVDIETLDDTENMWSGLYRETVTALTLKKDIQNSYTDRNASYIIKDFLSNCRIESTDTNGLYDLKEGLESGKRYGKTSDDERLVGTVSEEKMNEYSTKLFGKPLPRCDSHAYSVGYSDFFFYNTNNISSLVTEDTPAINCILYYNYHNAKYLFTEMIGYPMYNTEPEQSETKLLGASKHNDEISVKVYHKNEYCNYDNELCSYEGYFTNIYKKGENGYYWAASFGSE